MIEKDLVFSIHNQLLQKYGGEPGIRDEEHFLSAISRPYQAIDGKEVYGNSVKKAAALLESMSISRPFHSGNIRTAYVLYRYILLLDGIDIAADEEEKFNFMYSVTTGAMSFEKIVNWTEGRIIRL